MSFVRFSEGEDVLLKEGTWATTVFDNRKMTEVKVIGRNDPQREPSPFLIKQFKNSAKQINTHMDVKDRLRRKLEERRK